MFVKSAVYATILTFFSVVFGAPTLPGTCPDFKAIDTLDSSKLNGDWIGISKIKNGIEMGQGKCLKTTITAQSGGLDFTWTYKNSKDEAKTLTATGSAVDGKNTKLTLKKTGAGTDDKKAKTMTILDTDYTDYLVYVVCGSDGTNYGYVVHILSRKSSLADDKLTKVKAVLKSLNIPENFTTFNPSC